MDTVDATQPKKRGGKRHGSGRKPGKADKVIKGIRELPVDTLIACEKRIDKKLPWLYGQLFKLAEGIWVEKEMADGAVVVYKESPDLRAIIYLIDRRSGKPVSEVEKKELAQQAQKEIGIVGYVPPSGAKAILAEVLEDMAASLNKAAQGQRGTEASTDVDE